MKNLRFKTKSENPGNWAAPDMDYLYGLPIQNLGREEFYPELTDGISHWTADDRNTTTAPHPFEGRDIKVDLRNKSEEDRARLQRKTFALGYRWKVGPKTIIQYTDWPAFRLYGNKEMTIYSSIGEIYHNDPSATELTYQQFMDGVWPEEEEKGDSKPDAYILEHGGLYPSCATRKFKGPIIVYHNPDLSSTWGQDVVGNAPNYNFIPREEWMKKYGHKKEKLTFKGYDVKVSGNTVAIGCVTTTTDLLAGVFDVLKESNASSEELAQVSLYDLLNFLKENRVKLKLIKTTLIRQTKG